MWITTTRYHKTKRTLFKEARSAKTIHIHTHTHEWVKGKKKKKENQLTYRKNHILVFHHFIIVILNSYLLIIIGIYHTSIWVIIQHFRSNHIVRNSVQLSHQSIVNSQACIRTQTPFIWAMSIYQHIFLFILFLILVGMLYSNECLLKWLTHAFHKFCFCFGETRKVCHYR